MDVLTPEERTYCMSRIHGRDTSPELALRRAVWGLGVRYRLHLRIGKISPDLVFSREKVAVFVDGCFWHMCPMHGVMPATNRAFWKKKLEGNRTRDAANSAFLKKAGWRVIRLWEHEIEHFPARCARRIFDVVQVRMRKNRR